MSIETDIVSRNFNRFISEIQTAERIAALRRFFPFGREFSGRATQFLVPIPERNSLDIPTFSESHTREELIGFALHLREMVEWPIWSERTAFPAVKDQAGPGESLGQCLVTSRFAKNYFWHAKLVEVKVRNREGVIVGPHVVLEIPVLGANRKIEQHYLDLTHDQSMAIGPIPRYSIDISPRTKINLVNTSDPESPYIFVRYQTDEDLEQKASQPLRHSELVLEMVAYRYAYEKIQGPERYAEVIDIFADNTQLFEDFGREYIESLRSAVLYAKENYIRKPGTVIGTPTIKFGIIQKRDFLPNPDWIWKVSGLRGYSEAIILNDGFPQMHMVFSGQAILMFNFEGDYSPELLTRVAGMVRPLDVDYEVMVTPSVLEKYNFQKSISGPIFVR